MSFRVAAARDCTTHNIVLQYEQLGFMGFFGAPINHVVWVLPTRTLVVLLCYCGILLSVVVL